MEKHAAEFVYLGWASIQMTISLGKIYDIIYLFLFFLAINSQQHETAPSRQVQLWEPTFLSTSSPAIGPCIFTSQETLIYTGGILFFITTETFLSFSLLFL